MPKNPFKRKSSTSALDDVLISANPAVSSFRVIDRTEKINLNGEKNLTGGVRPVTRPFNSPLTHLRGRSAEELNAGLNRGSGGTTHSGSSGYYDSSSASARHSSTSTLPSSVDVDRDADDDELFPRRTKTAPMFQNVPLDDDVPPPPLRTRQRAFSFGQKGKAILGMTPHPPPSLPPKTAAGNTSPKRERAMTTSSYASTAKPDPNMNYSTPDFGSEFGYIYDRPRSPERYHPSGRAAPTKTGAQRHWSVDSEGLDNENEPLFPPRTLSKDSYRGSPELRNDDPGSPYAFAWDRDESKERLMVYSPSTSPALDGAPLPPPHRTEVASVFRGSPELGYSALPNRDTNHGDRMSLDDPLAYLANHIHETDESFESKQNQPTDDWRAKPTNSNIAPAPMSTKSSASELGKAQTRSPSGFPSQASVGASRAMPPSPYSSDAASFMSSESRNSTPRAAKIAISRQQEDDSLFDSSPVGPPSRAIRPQQSGGQGGIPKKMTKAQFERLRKRADSSAEPSDEEQEEGWQEDEEEEIDDSERARQLARQRQKQEANMSVYRQQMKKVTGGAPTDLPFATRPPLERTSLSAPPSAGGAPSIHLSGITAPPPFDAIRARNSDDDDDEDVPLGILQAHGFPSSSRPPTRTDDLESSHSRKASLTGSVVAPGASQGNLPPFARKLPADPYFGSSLVNQANREAMGMSSTPPAGSGMPQMVPIMHQPPPPPSSMGHPGGLVGVIAGEERAKAARRGSPNPATGGFGPGPQMPLPPTMPYGMPPRAMSAGSLPHAQPYMVAGAPPNPMMGMPMMGQMQQPPIMSMQNSQQQDQMQQFMAFQMQVMQSMLAMQQQQMGQTPTPPIQPSQTPDYLNVPLGHGNSAGKSIPPSVRNFSSAQPRAMTMLNPPTRFDVPQTGPRPNSDMPKAYAPSGLNISTSNGLIPGYTPSIAPSERSNIGMPSRYRPVTIGTDASGRSTSPESSIKLQPYANNRTTTPSPDGLGSQNAGSKTTIRVIDKPKGAARVVTRPVAAAADDEDDEDGWAEMKKKREDRKMFRFNKRKSARPEGEFEDYSEYS